MHKRGGELAREGLKEREEKERGEKERNLDSPMFETDRRHCAAVYGMLRAHCVSSALCPTPSSAYLWQQSSSRMSLC
jgi:hypothetical protein